MDMDMDNMDMEMDMDHGRWRLLGRGPRTMFTKAMSIHRYVHVHVPGPPHCAYGPRVPVSCVPHAPEAQGPGGQLLYVE